MPCQFAPHALIYPPVPPDRPKANRMTEIAPVRFGVLGAATPAGQPQYFNTANGQQNQLGRYGLINSGPLMGTAFGPNGTTYAFNYGTGVAGVNIYTGLGGTAQGVIPYVAF